MKVFLNPGHCIGAAPGACGCGLQEASVAMEVGKLTQKYLDAAGVEVRAEGFPDMSKEEARKYLAYVMDKVTDPILSLKISPEKDGKVGLRYASRTVKFERIRRITGYLVGTIDRWNNAKKAEEQQRLRHE